MNSERAQRVRRRWLALGAGLACLSMAGGCYERVIKADGLGAGGIAVQKPYANNTMLDNALMGPPTEPGKKHIRSSHWESTAGK